MAETKKRASVNFYQGAEGPTLMFLIDKESDLLGLKTIFLRLARGDAGNISLRTEGIVEFASAIDDLIFVRLLDEHEPSRMVRKVRDTLRGPLFEFHRHKEGWLECAELLDGLKGRGHQYLSRGSMDEALVMVSYQESLRKE
jgi:hypothetical protein